ncbi:MAG: hypothetical protein M1132_05955 [Chloroflexi bacterium]|nr:hypothetical protein [Chloroflexota bacterium]MCL5951255.1 hypothetical protein [Chloroflexota bacterium]
MSSVQVAMLLLGALILLVLALVVWGFVRVRASATTVATQSPDGLLLGGLVLAAFAAGAFAALILFAFVAR